MIIELSKFALRAFKTTDRKDKIITLVGWLWSYMIFLVLAYFRKKLNFKLSVKGPYNSVFTFKYANAILFDLFFIKMRC